jgi:GntR family transcriptional repressor for pyruvate dehydrogenase complex
MSAVTDTAILKLRDIITSGELKPGDKLPKEPELAQRLGLSRSSLREAVKALAMVRVLDVRQGDGTYVTSLEPALLMGAMEFVVDFHTDETVLQFLEVRRILEPAATAISAGQMTDTDINALEDHLDHIGDDPSVEQLVASDLAFHRMIAQGSANTVLCSLLDSLSGPIQRARIWRGHMQPNALQRTQTEHRAIIAAMRTRIPDVASAQATVHISGVEQWLRRVAAPEALP